jgi:hypothetical protein
MISYERLQRSHFLAARLVRTVETRDSGDETRDEINPFD